MNKLDEAGKALVREKIVMLTLKRRQKIEKIEREYQKEVTRLRDMIDFGVPQRMAP